MLTKLQYLAITAAMWSASAALAEQTPMSVIDWLNNQPAPRPVVLQPDEPDVANTGAISNITVLPLDADTTIPVGLVPSNVTGLPDTLWTGSDASTLERRITAMPPLNLPAAQSLFYTLLLAETAPPSGNVAAFHLARTDALLKLGALDPALAMLEQIDPTSGPDVMARYFDASLLNDSEDAACQSILVTPFLAPNYGARVFCTARSGDWDTATLLLGTARALAVLPERQVQVLERFLDPDLFEGEPPLQRPTKPDALTFRLYEALGQPIGTQNWPRVYANADLRDVAGWKAQLDAAERLARTGALPANRLLGVYSERRPAASGGIWDRVAAVQRFETALGTGSRDAVLKTLPKAWVEMKNNGLAVPFATLFAQDLMTLLPDVRLTHEVALTSPLYEAAAQTTQNPFLKGLAKGTPTAGTTPLEQAIAAGFAPDILPKSPDALGQYLLETLQTLEAGAEGELSQLTRALLDLRAVGLEDTARRAALQLMILGPA